MNKFFIKPFLWFLALLACAMLAWSMFPTSTKLDYMPDNLTQAQKAEAIQKANQRAAVASQLAVQRDQDKAAKILADELGQKAFSEGRVYCQEHLKSPTTAKFSRLHLDENTGFKTLSNNQWLVFGFVDAQNEFGAMLRNDWEAVLKTNGGSFDVEYLRIGNQELGKIPKDISN